MSFNKNVFFSFITIAVSGKEQGNLIPFYLTSDYSFVPRLLRGIHGIKWFNPGSRRNAWRMLTEAILGGNDLEEQIMKIKDEIINLVEKNSETYLCDPPYDKDTPKAGMPIIYDPPPDGPNSDDPSSRPIDHNESDRLVSSSENNFDEPLAECSFRHKKKRSAKVRLIHFVRKKIVNRVFH